MYDFIMAAFPWIVMGLGVAIVCANGSKINIYWEKLCKSWSNDSNK